MSTSQSTASSTKVINVGTRKSKLAMVQAEATVASLKQAWPEYEYKIHAISTMGDKNQVTALHDFGAKSLWTFELEKMLLDSDIDMIVHCLKDIPTQIPEQCDIGAILERADPRDAVVLHPQLPPGTTLASLPANSIIGTSSVRRSAQLKRQYPHLRFQSVRGNVGTRLSKLDDSDLAQSPVDSSDVGSKQGQASTVDEQKGTHYSALILAAAGLLRLDLGHRITRYLGVGDTYEKQGYAPQTKDKGILYAVGQGALAIEIRKDDKRILDLLKPLHAPKTALACLAERSLMRTLEGGCSVPIGVETEWSEDSSASDTTAELVMRAIVVNLAGTESAEAEVRRTIKSEAEADQMGRDVAAQLVSKGADKILETINVNRNIVEKQGGA